MLKVGGPSGGQSEAGVQHSQAEEQGGAGHQRGRDVDQLVLQQGDLDQVLRGEAREGKLAQLSQVWAHLPWPECAVARPRPLPWSSCGGSEGGEAWRN